MKHPTGPAGWPSRGASGGLAWAQIQRKFTPPNHPRSGAYDSTFQPDRGRLSYIQPRTCALPQRISEGAVSSSTIRLKWPSTIAEIRSQKRWPHQACRASRAPWFRATGALACEALPPTRSIASRSRSRLGRLHQTVEPSNSLQLSQRLALALVQARPGIPDKGVLTVGHPESKPIGASDARCQTRR